MACAALAPFTLFSVELTADSRLVVAGLACTALVGLVAHVGLRPLDIFGDDPSSTPASASGSNPSPDPGSAPSPAPGSGSGSGSAGSRPRRPGFKLMVLQLSLLCASAAVVWTVDALQAGAPTRPLLTST